MRPVFDSRMMQSDYVFLDHTVDGIGPKGSCVVPGLVNPHCRMIGLEAGNTSTKTSWASRASSDGQAAEGTKAGGIFTLFGSSSLCALQQAVRWKFSARRGSWFCHRRPEFQTCSEPRRGSELTLGQRFLTHDQLIFRQGLCNLLYMIICLYNNWQWIFCLLRMANRMPLTTIYAE